MYFETKKKFLLKIFIYYFNCVLQGSKFINVTAFRMVNFYLYLLLGNRHTNKSRVAFSGTCITVNLLDCDAKMGMSYGCFVNYGIPLHLSLKFCNRFNR